jgi:hypothetical protein
LHWRGEGKRSVIVTFAGNIIDTVLASAKRIYSKTTGTACFRWQEIEQAISFVSDDRSMKELDGGAHETFTTRSDGCRSSICKQCNANSFADSVVPVPVQESL